MRTFFGEKKYVRIISVMLVLCILAGVVGVPFKVDAAVTKKDLHVYNHSGFNTEIELEDTNAGVKCTYITTSEDNPRSFINRVGSADICDMSSIGNGIHLELQDIKGKTEGEGYTFVLAMGDNFNASWNPGQYRAWVNKDHGRATILTLESDGDYKAYDKTCDGSTVYPNAVAANKVITSGKLQKTLDDSIGIDIVRQGSENSKWIYTITVNGESFTMNTPQYVENPYINFGLYGPDSSKDGNYANMAGASFVVTDFSAVIPVKSATLSETSLVLDKVGDTAILTATVNPLNATYKHMTWTSGNSEVATVEDGHVTAVGIGQTEITVTVDGKVATCTVYVGIEPALTTNDLYVYNHSGFNTEIALQDTPAGVKCTYNTISEDNPRSFINRVGSLDVCDMSAIGNGMHLELQDVKGKAEGEGYTFVLAMGDNYNSNWQAGQYRAWVNKDHGRATVLTIESDGDYKAYDKKCDASTVYPNAVAASSVITSGKLQNTLADSISIDIVRQGSSAGKWTYTITVNGESFTMSTPQYVENPYINFGLYGPDSSKDGDYANMAGASFVITDFSAIIPIESIAVRPSVAILKGTETQLTASVKPESIETPNMTWTSADSSVVEVLDEKTGVIRGVATGETTVTVAVGGKTATCNVSVVDSAIGGYFSTTGIVLKESDSKITAEYITNQENSHEQVHTATAYDAEQGIHMEIPTVTVPDGTDYTVAIALGNNYVQGYNKDGYMIVYNRAGYFGIFKTVNGQENPVDETKRLIMQKRENFSGSLTLDLIQQGDTYVLTVNGATYSLPVLEGNKELYFSISLLGGPEFKTDANGNNRWVGIACENVTFGEGTNFVVHPISTAYQAPTLPTVDEVEKAEVATMEQVAAKTGKLDIEENNGIKITYNEQSKYYSRIVTTTTYSSRTGVHIELTDIAPSEAWGDDYSIGISFGNSEEQWFNKAGYMMVYDSQGNFQIMAMKEGSDFSSKTRETVVCVKREALAGSLTIDLKRQNDMYVLTVNGKTYTLAAENDIFPLTSTKNLYIGFGIMDGGKIGTPEFNVTKGSVDGDKSDGSLVGATYTIKKLFSVEDLGQDDKNIPPSWIGYSGSAFTFKEVEGGVNVAHVIGAAAWERFKVKTPYLTNGKGVTYEFKDIFSESDEYSIAICFGGSKHVWYDNKGVMLLYGKSGNMALLAPSGKQNQNGGVEDQNNAKVIASDKLTFKDSLTVNVRASGDGFIFKVNGKEYRVDGEYLDYTNQVYVQVGVMGDFELNNGDVSNLEYWEAGFRSKPVSFMLKKPVGEIASDEEIPGTPVNPKDYGMFYVREEQNLLLYKEEKGLKFVHTANAMGWERIAYQKRFTPQGNGINLVFEDITSKANRYTLAVFLGDDTWYNSNGYMILYGKDGNFAIVANNGKKSNPNISPAVVSEKREELGDKLSINVKLKDKNYVITVNGKLYTVPAQYEGFGVKNPKSLQVALGVLGGGKIGTLDIAGKAKNNYVSFIITKATGMIDPKYGKEFGMTVKGYNWTLEAAGKGTKVTHGIDGVGWERVSLNDAYATTEGGLCMKLTDITSKDPNYSLAIMLGNSTGPWYDTAGYMIIYGRSGNFSIIATDSSVINPNKSAVMISEKRERLGKSLDINVRLSEDDYKITVNGKTYMVPAEHDEYPLTDVEKLYISLGEFSDDEVGKLIYNKEFKKSELSFKISSVYHSTESVIEEEILEVEEEKEVVGPGKRPSSLGVDQKEEESNANVFAIVGGIGGVLLLTAGIAGLIIWKKKKKTNAEQSTEV